MIDEGSMTFKKLWPWCVIGISGLFSVYACFVCLISIWVGLGHVGQAGFWVPLVSGILVFCAILWIFLRVTKRLLNYMEKEDMILR